MVCLEGRINGEIKYNKLMKNSVTVLIVNE